MGFVVLSVNYIRTENTSRKVSYSPECNAIEEGISKVKNGIRSNSDKNAENMIDLIGEALDHVTESNTQGFIRHWQKMTVQS